jgi:AcrR family transcriptional regulator
VTAARAIEIREPKQERSRRTFERIRDATLTLLRERGPDAFTLAEVCARADASMGAIYGRVSGKDELIRLLHEQELGRIDVETRTILDPADDRTATLEQAVTQLVIRMGTLLRANSAILRPFMLRAGHDTVISDRGRTSHQLMKNLFITTLMAHSAEIQHRDRERAVEWSFTVVYSVTARRLGLGSTIEGSDDDVNWTTILEDLAATVTAYLLRPPLRHSTSTALDGRQ